MILGPDDVRVIALQKAVEHSTSDTPHADVVETAEAFHAFLTKRDGS